VPKLKPEEIALRRREIVEAARRCFIRSGFHQTTTDEICREASITPGGLYHYFSNKEELIKAVVQYAADNALEMVHEARTTEPDPRSALRRMGAFFLQAFYEPDFENIARLDLETWSEALRNEDLLRIIHQGRGATRNTIADVIREGVNRGDLTEKIDPVALANLFAAINTGLRLGRLLGPNDVDPNKVMEALGILIRGELLPKPDAAPPADGKSPAGAERTG
jgi:AcrR family transcriptional regulator